ncbi:MAG: FAD-binding protein [Dehalococcoidia bacterium]|nr:FAD-binding protein [Dehalococcoidia bacterium]
MAQGPRGAQGVAGQTPQLDLSWMNVPTEWGTRAKPTKKGLTVSAINVGIYGEVPDHWRHHLKDTLEAGRGLCDGPLAQLLCEEGPECVAEMDRWGVGWARKDGRIKQATAPGHDRPRCVYVDFLNTGPAVSRTLRSVLHRISAIRRIGDLCITDLILSDGEVVGAVAFHHGSGAPIVISAKATVLATGGLTRLYRRSSASANMGGDGYALALRAGASLVDMEFVQFFPIGHLAPRLIGMDPIMWDPFRYKLGGRLLNALGEEFAHRYGTPEDGQYRLPRDIATLAIFKEVEAGRGSPHGGVYLSFQHCSETALREAFGPVIDRLAANHIDLTRMPVEVAPIAHYHMGGIKVDARMETEVPGLLAAGEAVGGANGANRLSGNAITEALVFGSRAGRSAAERARSLNGRSRPQPQPREALDLITAQSADEGASTAAMVSDLQATMTEYVGPIRTEARLDRGLARIDALSRALGERPPGVPQAFDMRRLEWFDLRNMLLVARTVATAARARTESRGAHQREDFAETSPEWRCHQIVRLDGEVMLTRVPIGREAAMP